WDPASRRGAWGRSLAIILLLPPAAGASQRRAKVLPLRPVPDPHRSRERDGRPRCEPPKRTPSVPDDGGFHEPARLPFPLHDEGSEDRADRTATARPPARQNGHGRPPQR